MSLLRIFVPHFLHHGLFVLCQVDPQETLLLTGTNFLGRHQKRVFGSLVLDLIDGPQPARNVKCMLSNLILLIGWSTAHESQSLCRGCILTCVTCSCRLGQFVIETSKSKETTAACMTPHVHWVTSVEGNDGNGQRISGIFDSPSRSILGNGRIASSTCGSRRRRACFRPNGVLVNSSRSWIATIVHGRLRSTRRGACIGGAAPSLLRHGRNGARVIFCRRHVVALECGVLAKCKQAMFFR